MLSQKEKELFKVLVVYWQNHIDAHSQDYQTWIDQTKNSAPGVHENLIQAKDNFLKSKEALLKAKILFNQGES
jgi:hypothetical protein